MEWSGLEWRVMVFMVWYGGCVRCGMLAWYGEVWSDKYDMLQYGVFWYSMAGYCYVVDYGVQCVGK